MMLDTNFVQCTGLPDEPLAGRRLLELLRSCGGKLLGSNYGMEKDGADWITPSGAIFSRGIEHPILAKGAFHYSEHRIIPPREHGTGSFSYVHVDVELLLKMFTFGQDAQDDDYAHWNEIGASVLRFVRMMYPLLRPRFGWIDEFGDNVARRFLKPEPPVLFWGNIYGPDMVRHLGRDFLLNAPGGRKEELDDGGILYLVTPTFSEWHERSPAEALRHFQTKIPGMRLYHAKPVDMPDELSRIVVTDASGKETIPYERARKGKKRKS